MNKLFCMGLAVAAAASAFAESSDRERKIVRVKRAEVARLQGGRLLKPGSYAGKIAIVNRQARVPESDLAAVAKVFAGATRCNFGMSPDGKDAKVVVTVVDAADEPTLLVATEEHWAKVNVARLVDDLPGEDAKRKFFVPRARKMIAKALSILCGGGSSQFGGNLMNAVTVRDLDLADEQIPVDMLDRYASYLGRMGITKREMVYYAQACQEGWAPVPTNDIQKAIWDKVHAIPDKPMKIQFDPAAQKGKVTK